MTLIRFLKQASQHGAFAGDEMEFEETLAAELVASGTAEMAPLSKEEAKEAKEAERQAAKEAKEEAKAEAKEAKEAAKEDKERQKAETEEANRKAALDPIPQPNLPWEPNTTLVAPPPPNPGVTDVDPLLAPQHAVKGKAEEPQTVDPKDVTHLARRTFSSEEPAKLPAAESEVDPLRMAKPAKVEQLTTVKESKMEKEPKMMEKESKVEKETTVVEETKENPPQPQPPAKDPATDNPGPGPRHVPEGESK